MLQALQLLGRGFIAVPKWIEQLCVLEYGISGASVQDMKPLLKEACEAVFGNAAGLVDMMVRHFPSSKAGSAMKARALSLQLTPPVHACLNCLCRIMHTLCLHNQQAVQGKTTQLQALNALYSVPSARQVGSLCSSKPHSRSQTACNPGLWR